MTDAEADPIAAEARVFLEILTAGKPEAWTLSWNARKQLMDFMEKVAGMKAAGRAEASAWKPIAEAPKDGKVIWIANSECERIVLWNDNHWCDLDSHYGSKISLYFTPTHWQPLPSLPPPPPEGGE